MGLLALWAAVSCGGGPPAGPDEAPVITIDGVTDGASVDGPVTITISVDRGSYRALLNGAVFLSGNTVSTPGPYALEVTARNGDATSVRSVAFTILLGGDTRLIVRLLDLGANESGGGGAAILLTDSSGAGARHALVDAGPAGPGGGDAGFVARRLATLGVDTLEALILTHAHSDHFGGMSPVLQQVVVRTFYYNGQVRNFSGYTQTISTAGAQANQVVIPAAVESFDLGLGAAATDVSVLPPLTTFLSNPAANGSELNEGSLGTAVEKGGVRLFFTGDGEVAANQRWRTQYAGLTRALDVLNVGHHGANDAVFDNGAVGASTWLSHTAPEIAVVSANGVTHPRINATAYLLSLPQTRTYCTHTHGDIEVRVGETGNMEITVTRNGAANCTAGTNADS